MGWFRVAPRRSRTLRSTLRFALAVVGTVLTSHGAIPSLAPHATPTPMHVSLPPHGTGFPRARADPGALLGPGIRLARLLRIKARGDGDREKDQCESNCHHSFHDLFSLLRFVRDWHQLHVPAWKGRAGCFPFQGLLRWLRYGCLRSNPRASCVPGGRIELNSTELLSI